jgi:hypothetical protein
MSPESGRGSVRSSISIRSISVLPVNQELSETVNQRHGRRAHTPVHEGDDHPQGPSAALLSAFRLPWFATLWGNADGQTLLPLRFQKALHLISEV